MYQDRAHTWSPNTALVDGHGQAHAHAHAHAHGNTARGLLGRPFRLSLRTTCLLALRGTATLLARRQLGLAACKALLRYNAESHARAPHLCAGGVGAGGKRANDDCRSHVYVYHGRQRFVAPGQRAASHGSPITYLYNNSHTHARVAALSLVPLVLPPCSRHPMSYHSNPCRVLFLIRAGHTREDLL